MRDLNIDFIDLYKSVDRFIRDAYSTAEGVSEYIRQMEQNDFKGRHYVATWGADYDRLKRLRWIRNQLSHEVGYDSDICENTDYDWLEAFSKRLYSANDPLSSMINAEKADHQRRLAEQRRIQTQKLVEEERRQQMQKHHQQQPASTYSYTPQTQHQPPKRKSFWQRLKDFFSGN
ncbi:MAG: hypothetical protein K6B52_08005 [Clostridiales bacterium]|nr:hypothetical protein [Clostridiales bacterium]